MAKRYGGSRQLYYCAIFFISRCTFGIILSHFYFFIFRLLLLVYILCISKHFFRKKIYENYTAEPPANISIIDPADAALSSSLIFSYVA